MITKRWNLTSWVLVCAILLSLLVTNSVAAQSPRGGGPDEAMTPDGQWKELQSGQQHWYRFHYAQDDKWAGQPVEIRIYSEPSEGAVLTVRNEEQAQLWRRDGTNVHFGCCTLFDIDKNNDGVKDYALWSGALTSTADYYIVVEHAKNLTQPVRYRFEISGPGLSFPGVAPQAAPRAVPPPAVQERVLSSLTGTAPDFPMAPTSEWKELKAGDYHWYTFNYDQYDKRDNPTLEIKLLSEPYQGAILTVRNEEQANRWRKDGKHEWFGCASPANVDRDNNGTPDYELWAGKLSVSGRYYIVVGHTKNFSQPVYYNFTMKGEGFSFVGATVAPAAAPQAVAAPVVVEPARAPTGLTGTGPDYAMRPTSAWTELGEGQYHWYAFHFGYDSKWANQPITIRLYSEPNEGAILTVRNSEQADIWRKLGEHQHVGCCTPFSEDLDKDGKPDYALWSGALGASGTYYIVVEHARNISGPVHYSFVIEGPGLSY